jgi:hypothetical protein
MLFAFGTLRDMTDLKLGLIGTDQMEGRGHVIDDITRWTDSESGRNRVAGLDSVAMSEPSSSFVYPVKSLLGNIQPSGLSLNSFFHFHTLNSQP